MADIPQPFSNYLAEAIAPEVKAKVKEIFDKWVNNYYASYSPIYYSRTYGLRDAYVCEVYGNLLVFESDASLLNGSHRVSNEYIYDRMFLKDGMEALIKEKVIRRRIIILEISI